MRWWVLLSSLWLTACGNEAEESFTVVTERQSTADSQPSSPVDTSPGFAVDTASHASFTTPAIKKPSGIYQFLLPYTSETKILHTIAFYPGTYRLQEEYIGQDSVVVTEGTWAPSQGYIWLYKEQLVGGRYAWKGDTLQYLSPRQNKKFSLAKLTPVNSNPVWQNKRKEGTVMYGVGNEPFWSIEVDKTDSIILSMPDLTQPLRAKLSGTTRQTGNTVYTASADSLQVTVYPYFCSDGMSDFTYPNKITVRYKGQTLNGCGVSF
jgi:uncharacterized membrane protein